MTPLESLVSDATILSINLGASLMTIVKAKAKAARFIVQVSL
jgi:hypothetical protein